MRPRSFQDHEDGVACGAGHNRGGIVSAGASIQVRRFHLFWSGGWPQKSFAGDGNGDMTRSDGHILPPHLMPTTQNEFGDVRGEWKISRAVKEIHAPDDSWTLRMCLPDAAGTKLTKHHKGVDQKPQAGIDLHI